MTTKQAPVKEVFIDGENSSPEIPPDLAKKIQEAQEQVWREVEEEARRKKELGIKSDYDPGEPGSHLLFANQLNEDDETVQAIQHLVYNEDEPDETAEHLKKLGNQLLQKYGSKFYMDALKYYSDALALKDKITKKELLVALFTNRAHVHIIAGNFGHAISDCYEALKLEPNNIKAHYRLIKAAIEVQKFELAIDVANRALALDPKNTAVQKEKETAEKKLAAMQERKRIEEQKAKEKQERPLKVARMLQAKGIKIGQEELQSAQYSQLAEEPDLSHFKSYFKEFGFGITQEDTMCFRALFLYDEFGQSDVIQFFDETNTLQDHIDEMFPPYGPAFPFGNKEDEARYTVPNLAVYFFSQPKDKFIEIDMKLTLAQVLKRSDYALPSTFMPVFHILPKDSQVIKRWKEEQ